jgi:hypothetical protein
VLARKTLKRATPGKQPERRKYLYVNEDDERTEQATESSSLSVGDRHKAKRKQAARRFDAATSRTARVR